MARIKNAAAFDIFEFRQAVPDSPAFADVPALPEKPALLDNLNRPLPVPEVGTPPEDLDISGKLRWLIWNTPGGISYPQAAEALGVPEENFRIKGHEMHLNMEIRDTGKRFKDKQGYLRVVWAGPLQSEAA